MTKIDSRHWKFEEKISKQKRCRIACSGEDEVKNQGTTFLPMLSGQDPDDYEAYKQRASYFNASGRTLAGLTGLVFRKPPKVDFPDDDFLDSVSYEGENIIVFLRRLVNEELRVGRVGVLADLKDGDSVSDPHLSMYVGESIINWRTDVINGKKRLVMVVLEEEIRDYSEDFYEGKEGVQYRVLALVDGREDTIDLEEGDTITDFVKPVSNDDIAEDDSLRYVVVVYEKQVKKNKEVWVLKEKPFFPNVRGVPIKEIPFVFINPNDLVSDNLVDPPLLDVVNVNLSHYRGSADLKHGLHFTALPTPYVAVEGLDVSKQFKIGSAIAWTFDTNQVSIGVLEFSGAGLGAIKEEQLLMQDQMAVLGSRLLEEPKRIVEASATHRQRKSGEESIIANIAGNVSEGVEKALRFCAEWKLLDPDEVLVTLNKDYVAESMDPVMVTTLMSLLQGGRLSYDTFFYNLQKGELVPDGRTMEEELDLIEVNPPVPSGSELDLGEEKGEIEDVDGE